MPGFNIPQQACGNGNSTSGPSATPEMARDHRFIIEVLEPLGDTRSGYLVRAHKCGRPSPEMDRVAMHHGQDEIYFPGKNRWQPIDFSFYEEVSGGKNQIASKIYSWWSSATLNISTSTIKSDFKKQCTTAMRDGAGTAIWSYKMYGCWPSKISPKDLDYSSTSISEISVKMEMDKATES